MLLLRPSLAANSGCSRVKLACNYGGRWIVFELQEGFGWDPFKRLFADYQTMPKVSNDNKVKMNLWAEKFSQAVNKNLSPFFKAWGWPIDEATSQNLSTLPAWEEDPMKTYVAA